MKKPGKNEPSDTITAAQMRALEQQAMQSGAVSGDTLMERAGAGVVAGLLEWPEFSQGGRAIILCGPGNNGGDGYVISRLLVEAGWEVAVAGVGRADSMPPDAALNRERWETLGPVTDLLTGLPELSDPDVIVDAVFGTGLARGIEGALAQRLAEAETLSLRQGAHRIAVDLPSGIDTDTGRVLGAMLPAHRTITFHARKPAHTMRPDLCGAVTVVDIGL